MRVRAALMTLICVSSLLTPSAIAQPGAQATSTATGCAPGRKTEHFPNVDLWDAIRVIADDYHVPLHPAPSLPHVALDTDLTCYTRTMALQFLDGMDLRLLNVGTDLDPVYMVHPSGSAQRLAGTLKSFHLRYAQPDAEFLANVRTALPPDTFIAARKDTDTVIVGGSRSVLLRAESVIAAMDVATNSYATKIIPISSGMSATDVAKALSSRFPPNSIIPNDLENALVVSGTPDLVSAIDAAARQFTGTGWQVVIEATLVDVYPHQDTSSYGIRAGGVDAQGNTTPGSGSTVINIPGYSLVGNIAVDLNISKGMTDIHDIGNVKVLNNRKGTINDSTKYPYSYINPLTSAVVDEDQNIGLIIEATPTISNDGRRVTMDVKITESELEGFTAQQQPISLTHAVQTVLSTTDGAPVAISEVFENADIETMQKIPGIGDIPLFGSLFRYHNKTKREGHLAIIMTPHITRVQ